PSETHEGVDRHGPLEIVRGDADHHHARLPGTHVPPIAQIHLVDSVPVNAEVEYLHVPAEQLLQVMAPGLLERHLEGESVRVADERHAIAGAPAREAHVRARASNAFDAAE